jgi:RluA family pseudouridine synthase
MSALDFLNTILSHVSEEEWKQSLAEGRVRVRDEDRALTAEDRVHTGMALVHVLPGQTEPAVSTDIRVLHEDDWLVVLEKPAPLPVHPGGRFNLNTLLSFLHTAYAPGKPRLAHRLDADTTGLIVCSKTQRGAKHVQPMFARGEVAKTYLLRVHGSPSWEEQRCDASVGLSGVMKIRGPVEEEDGDAASTEFRVLRRDGDTTLLEARPLTGRTNQIRLHAWHLGHPIVGDRIYLREGQLAAESSAMAVGDAPLCLHSWKIKFTHPTFAHRCGYAEDLPVAFEARMPSWA